MADLGDFAVKITKLGKRIEVNATKSTTKLAASISQTVILATPVDTGVARNNWFATLSSPSIRVSGQADPSGLDRVKANNSKISARKSEQSIYITNNLPYIKRLNEGHSAQAPAGFVEKAIAAAQRQIKAMRLLKR